MDTISQLFGIDSLKRLSFVVGVLLMGFGFLYPIQKIKELDNRTILLSESSNINHQNIEQLEKEANFADTIVADIKTSVIKYKSIRDSIINIGLHGNLTESQKFLINYLVPEINRQEDRANSFAKNISVKLSSVQIHYIKINTVIKQLENLEKDIKLYEKLEWSFIGVGVTLFLYGFVSLSISQNENDKLKKIEMEIKTEELRLLKKQF